MAYDDTLTNMSISLPIGQKEYLKTRAAATGCATASEYVRRLIHADQLALERASLERLLVERLDEPSTPFTGRDWARIRARVRRKLEARKKVR